MVIYHKSSLRNVSACTQAKQIIIIVHVQIRDLYACHQSMICLSYKTKERDSTY